ncbi:hypothetical protein [Microbacterium album]|uniref:Adhesin domain-containing protein n=1 Tax=Microbacterium album TaxID=2053191 RepID=A0A917ML67_9MICO|nr:hypothetical protein [Microbacterium album]GGH40725.1 hypothetical protein GCM10010921_12840 [Microbacterium album]
MNDSLTPPPAPPSQGTPPPAAPGNPPAPAAPAPHQPRPGGAGKVVSVIAIVVGALVLIGTIWGSVRGAVADASRGDSTLTASAAGVTSLRVDAAAARFEIEFDDVDEAVLDVVGGRGGAWTLERRDGELRVTSPDRGWGWFGVNRGDERVVLTLPERLEDARLDADLTLAAGELRATGAFGALSLDVGAGGMDVRGAAESLDVSVSAGQAQFDLADVSDANLSVAAGRLIGTLTGDAPDDVTVSVSAGELDVELPRGAYDVRSDVSAGSFDNRLDVSRGARSTVDVEVAAGRAVLSNAR